MTDIQDLRSRIREKTAAEPERSSRLPFWLIAVGAIAAGFAAVMFVPRYFSSHGTAVVYVETPRAPVAAAPAASAQRYAGKTAEEMAKIADGVCAQRRRQRPACNDQRRRTVAQGQGRVRSRQADGCDRQERAGSERAACLSVDRGTRALLLAHPAAEDHRRRHRLRQGHREHQHVAAHVLHGAVRDQPRSVARANQSGRNSARSRPTRA